jgi:gamma-glutamyltranspeptidase/glutathione hydrolase
MVFTTRPELIGTTSMVATTHYLASATAMSVLERGGNAADAAVAAAFVLQIVEPHLNGPGGEVPILLWSETERKVSVICGQGVAPAAASVAALNELGLDLMPGTGHLPTVVPGAFGAWMLLLEQWGTWSVREVLQPAIDLAREGHPLLAATSKAIGTVAEMFQRDWPSSAQTWLLDGKVPTAGVRFRLPVLADMYERVVAEAQTVGGGRVAQIRAARAAWYEGFVAEAIGRFNETPVMDTSGEAHRGFMTADDLAGWEPSVEEPVSYEYHEYTVCKTGPWGQGPVFLQQLALLQGYDMNAMAVGSAEWVHTIVEASKLAFADREAWYGDPKFTDVPLDDLLSDSYNAQRRMLIGDTASLALRPGSPRGRPPLLPRYPDNLTIDLGQLGAGEPTIMASGETRGDTCHIDIVDRNGMMISATPSGGWLQGSPTVPGLGFCISTRGQMFWAQEGLPSSLRPGARPRITLTPSFALRDGEPWLAFGTPGGDFQDQWALHFFLTVVHGGLNLQAAIDQPSFHSIHMPNSFWPRDTHLGHLLMEDRFAPEVMAELRRMGHVITEADAWSLGSVSAVARDGDWLKAAASPRSTYGYAVGR